jgi:hypothetical protein
VETILAKPNYRHQKKQKEQARKLRQAEKQNRRLAARAGTQPLAEEENMTGSAPGAATAGQADT